jgi:Fic family protein
MDDLVAGYRQAVVQDRREPLIAVPLAVLDFLCIHPFRDGNGRVARLLTLLLLYHCDYRVGRYVSLERIIEESKQTYYEALEQSSQGWHVGEHPAAPWLRYFWGVLVRAYGEFEERVGQLLSGRGSKTHLVHDAVAKRIGPFSLADIEAASPGVSRDMVRHVLRQMRDEGAIELQGKGRGARWLKKE